MATREAIEALKANWLQDPCWDIETTEGFEDHRDELLAFRLHHEQVRNNIRQAQLEAKAVELGIPGNLALAAYVERLEDRIARLKEWCDRHDAQEDLDESVRLYRRDR